MKGKLNKVDNGYVLLVDNIMYATDNDKLSKQNCDEIFGVVDVDKLAEEFAKTKSSHSVFQNTHKRDFKAGFNKAMELNEDKVFTLEDVKKAYIQGKHGGKTQAYVEFDDYIQSLQQPTEIEITFNPDEKDSDGCLILKRFDMKNVFLLPTDKPSRVYNIIGSKRLGFTSKDPFYTENIGGGTLNQHIYITNSEEIKNGDWCLDKFNQRLKLEDKKLIGFDNKGIKRFSTDNISGHDCKKIILTTDIDLIKDGVQGIDDDFLEWFVKNPSCEFVRAIQTNEVTQLVHGNNAHYKIIIPKEEPKQECTCGVCDYCEEQETIQILKGAKENALKQETLEEAAKIYAKIPIVKSVDEEERYYNSACKLYDAFKAGAKWQSERMYSEEEAIQLLIKFNQEIREVNDVIGWFEKFKKK